MKLSKEKIYNVDGREGQWELTTDSGKECFFMFDLPGYEYFISPKIEETKQKKEPKDGA